MRKFSSFRRLTPLLLLSAAIAGPGLAGMIEMRGGEGSIEGVKLAKEAGALFPDGKSVGLKPYVSGIRKKKVALFWAKVYVGQVFTSEALPKPKSIDEAFAAVSKQSATAITLTFLRDVSIERMVAAFEDSFESNGFDPKTDPAIKPLLDLVQKGGEMKDGQMLSIVLVKKADRSDVLYYDNGKIQSADLAPGAAAKILKIWFGKPADSGIERLHDQFLGKGD